MTAINHAITGSLIAFVVINPIAAVILALASHFMLDSLPHYGPGTAVRPWFRSIPFKTMLIIDSLLCVTLVALFAIFQPDNWLLACVCAFAATSPDLGHINQYIKSNRHEKWKPSLFSRFSSKIQWFERPSGAFVEIVWFLTIGYLVIQYT
jgi:hypothetical protein